MRKTIMFVMLVAGLSLAVFPVAAQIEPIAGSDFDLPGAGGAGSGADEARDFIQNIINVFLSLVGIIAGAMLIYGGFQYITAAGDEQKAERAKRIILYAIIGLIVIGLAAAIVNFVIDAFSGGGAGGAGGGGGGR